jgi:hypothetical protein
MAVDRISSGFARCLALPTAIGRLVQVLTASPFVDGAQLATLVRVEVMVSFQGR